MNKAAANDRIVIRVDAMPKESAVEIHMGKVVVRSQTKAEKDSGKAVLLNSLGVENV